MELKEELLKLRASTGLNRREFADYFGIPYRTITDWELGSRQMSDYLLSLLRYRCEIELPRKEKSKKNVKYEISKNGMIYKRASVDDIDMLVKTRIEVLRAANRLAEDVDMKDVEENSRIYYNKALSDGMHVAYLVYQEEEFVAAGGISFFQVMPTYHNSTGRKAYIMNMYTRPEYRRRGIAYEVLDLLVNEAKDRGIFHISLEATAAGRPLYEKYGFVGMKDEMELRSAN